MIIKARGINLHVKKCTLLNTQMDFHSYVTENLDLLGEM